MASFVGTVMALRQSVLRGALRQEALCRKYVWVPARPAPHAHLERPGFEEGEAGYEMDVDTMEAMLADAPRMRLLRQARG